MARKIKPFVILIGQDGNVFNLLSICTIALKKAGQPENADKLQKEVTSAASYDEALTIMTEYCDVH